MARFREMPLDDPELEAVWDQVVEAAEVFSGGCGPGCRATMCADPETGERLVVFVAYGLTGVEVRAQFEKHLSEIEAVR